jgi:hypothetical protein
VVPIVLKIPVKEKEEEVVTIFDGGPHLGDEDDLPF